MGQKEKKEYEEPEAFGSLISAFVFLVIVLVSLCIGISMALSWFFAPSPPL